MLQIQGHHIFHIILSWAPVLVEPVHRHAHRERLVVQTHRSNWGCRLHGVQACFRLPMSHGGNKDAELDLISAYASILANEMTCA